MSASNDHLKCFCTCYNMLAWKKTFNTGILIHMNEKPYSCGRCLKGFSPSDNAIVHNLIPSLNLLSSLNIFNKKAITKMHLSTYNIIHDRTIELCPIKEKSKECLTNRNGNEKHCSNSETSINLAQLNEKSLHTDSNDSGNSKENPYACILCVQRFKQQNELTAHHMDHVKDKLLHCCRMCNSLFVQREQLASHMLIHKHDLRYCCSVCNNVFSNKATLSNHISTHFIKNSIGSYTCNACPENLSLNKGMIHHLSVHAMKNPCLQCYEVRKLQNGFPFFYGIHKEKKRHVCNVCNKRFLHIQSLQLHLSRHCGKEPSVCKVCHRTYPSKASLSRHYRQYPAHNKSVPACEDSVTDREAILDINEHNRIGMDTSTYETPLNSNEFNRAYTDLKDASTISDLNIRCINAVTERSNTLNTSELNGTSTVIDGTSGINEQKGMYIDVVTDEKNTLDNNEQNNMCIDAAAYEVPLSFNSTRKDTVTDVKATLNISNANKMCSGAVLDPNDTLNTNELNKTSPDTVIDGTDTNDQNGMHADMVTAGKDALHII